MEVVVIGEGGVLYHTRGKMIGSSFAVRNEDSLTVFDTGYCTCAASNSIPGLDIADIRTIFISHFHYDHIADICAYLDGIQKACGQKYGYGPSLEIIGPTGIEGVVRGGMAMLGDIEYIPKLTFRGGPGTYGEMEVFNVKHSAGIESVAAVFHGDSEIVYTGDINPNPDNIRAIIDAAESSDFLITEATGKTRRHIDIEFAINLMESGHFKKMLVGHIRPEHRNDVKRVCSSSGGKIIKAVRGSKITI